MGTGITEQWGLNEPSGPSSVQQAAEFKSTFQSTVSPVNEALQFTVTNAETSKHGKRASKRDIMISIYQNVVGKIDASDPSKAQSIIDQALAKILGAADEIVKFKDDVQKALEAWQEKEPTYEEAVGKVEEMEEKEFERASELRTKCDDILGQAKNKLWDPAVQAVTEFIAYLEPIYEKFVTL